MYIKLQNYHKRMTTLNDYTRETLISLRIEQQDHNFMGKSISESRQCSNPKSVSQRRTKLMGIKRYKRTLSKSILCDKQISCSSFENPSLLKKYNDGKKEESPTVKNVCFNLLKLKSMMSLNNIFVSFCCYNNTNKTSATSSTTSQQIQGGKSDSNNIIIRRNESKRRRSRGRRSVVAVIMQLCLFLLSCLSIVSYVESFQSNCPTICTCKWKNGKKKLLHLLLPIFQYFQQHI
jgi:hypothetical protein